MRSLDSVRSCDRIVVVDGAWEQYPHSRPDGRSDDGTIAAVIEWMMDWDGEGFLVLPKNPWSNQREKRNFYFKFAEPGDWILVIDGDERVASGMEGLKDWLGTVAVDGVRVHETVWKNPGISVTRYPGLSSRLIRFKNGLAYGRTYDEIFGVESEAVTDRFRMDHIRYGPTRGADRRVTKSQVQTSAAFASVTIGKEDNRIAGRQVRLLRFTSGLQYYPDQATYSGIRNLSDVDGTSSSALLVHHLEREVPHPDIY